MGKNLRQQSRDVQWASSSDDIKTYDEVNVGSLLRIADATENMAKNIVALQEERDLYKRRYEAERQLRRHAERRIIALKGVITRTQRTEANSPDA
jgi:hypothetical protein